MSRLNEILRIKQREAEALATPEQLDHLRNSLTHTDQPRGFLLTLRAQRRGLIAEIKRASPSRGVLTDSFDPTAMALAYQRGGADAVSVVTDREFFGGSTHDLMVARRSVTCPVLRKDFLLNEAQVLESRAVGADAILLIVRILDDASLIRLRESAEALGMDALVEAHSQIEIERAVSSGASIIGVNNRDLDNFTVDLTASERLRSAIPAGILAVSESGIANRQDADRLFDAGYDAILVGESIVRHTDREAAVRSLRPHATTGSVR